MARGNIKGITIEFEGNTTKLKKAIKDVESNTRAIDRELRAVNKALKFNPTSVELWRQKQQLLSQKIDETKNKLQLLKQQQASMDASGVEKNSTEYRKLEREIIETESKLKNFNSQLKAIGNVNLRATSEQFKQWGSSLQSAGQAMLGVSAAAGAVVASLGAISYKAATGADDLNTLSKVYSISTQDLQQYAYAADLVDVSVETIAKSHIKLEKSMYAAQNGTKGSVDAFAALGVSITDSSGNLRDSDAVWQDTIAALGNMTNETERDALALQLMGKSAAELNPLIEDGGETFANIGELMSKYDLEYVDQDTIDKANEFNDSLDKMKLLGGVAVAQLGSQLAAFLAPALEKVVTWVGKLTNWLSKLDPAVLTVIGVLATVVAAIGPVLIAVGKVATGISSIMSLVSTIGPMIGTLAGPIGIAIAVITALVAVGVLVYKNWDTIKAKAQEIWAKIVEVWNGIKEAVSTAVEAIKTVITTVFNFIKSFIIAYLNFYLTIFKTVWNGIKTVVTTVINAIKSGIEITFNAIKSFISNVWNGIKEAVSTAVEAIKTVITTVFNFIKSFIIAYLNFYLTIFKTVWNGIKTVVTTVINAIKSGIQITFNAIKSFITNVWNGIKSTTQTVWNGIKTAIINPVESAFNTVKGWVNKLKSLFPLNIGKIFTNLKIPHIIIDGGKAPYGIGGMGKKPNISVKWYAKGGIFTKPTLLAGNGLAGVGEAGAEAVLPISKLQEMVDFGNEPLQKLVANQTNILIAMYEEMKKEKNFKVDNAWAGRYVNGLVR